MLVKTHIKIIKSAATCFGSRMNNHRRAEQCLAKITSMVPAYLLICFVASTMAAYSNLL